MLAKILKDTAKREHIEKEAIRLQEERANAEDSDDEEDAASRAAADARQQQTEEAAKDIERRKAASNGPPIFAQVLFPTDVSQAWDRNASESMELFMTVLLILGLFRF